MMEDKNWPQFKIRLRPELIDRIKEAAWVRRQNATQWCTELFEAALEDEAMTLSLVDRVQRLEKAVFQSSNHENILQ